MCTWLSKINKNVTNLAQTTLVGFFNRSVIEGLSSLSAPDSPSPHCSISGSSSSWLLPPAHGGVAGPIMAFGGADRVLNDSPNIGGGIRSFSWMIRPPRFEVFSTARACDIPCSVRPNPWPCYKTIDLSQERIYYLSLCHWVTFRI